MLFYLMVYRFLFYNTFDEKDHMKLARFVFSVLLKYTDILTFRDLGDVTDGFFSGGYPHEFAYHNSMS